MDLETQNIQFAILLVSLFSILIPSTMYSPLNKYFRIKGVYFTLLFLYILLLTYSCWQIESKWKDYQKTNALAPIMMISYLIFFKLNDIISLKKYNRFMNYSCRLSITFNFKEASEQTFFEMGIQFLMIVLSFVAWILIGLVVEYYY